MCVRDQVILATAKIAALMRSNFDSQIRASVHTLWMYLPSHGGFFAQLPSANLLRHLRGKYRLAPDPHFGES